MSLYKKHKSIIESTPFGVVIENNTNQDAYVDFLDNHYLSYGMNKKEGVKIYPLYKDLYFSDMTMLSNYILSKGSILVDITKFQSSLMFQMYKQYVLTIKETNAIGEQLSRPLLLRDNYGELVEYTKQINYSYIINYNTSFGITVDKYTDMVIKFYPQENKTNIKSNMSYFDEEFQNIIKTKDTEKLNEEKRKRIRILI